MPWKRSIRNSSSSKRMRGRGENKEGIGYKGEEMRSKRNNKSRRGEQKDVEVLVKEEEMREREMAGELEEINHKGICRGALVNGENLDNGGRGRWVERR